jgi:two-component system sensor histidine kinase KdpD
MRGERVANQQLLLERHDASHVAVSAYAGPLHDKHDQPIRVIVLIQDVSQLRQAEQLKDDFLALISHEFRTPLTAIHGGAHMLAREGDTLDTETRNELLTDVVAESERLDRMLGNILTLANVMAGRLPVETEPVLVEPLVKRVVSSVSQTETRHQFIIDIPAGTPPVEADPGLLEQVLRNLYENAIKYAPNGGEVRTDAGVSPDGVAIRVCDQGIGISPEHVRTVFERFRRVGGDPTVRGMGLGLYLSRHLVEAQHGTIAASSEGPGRGTEFTVMLPVAIGWSNVPEETEAVSEGSL